MAQKNNKTTTVRINERDYYRLEDVLESEYNTTQVPFAVAIEHLLDEYEE